MTKETEQYTREDYILAFTQHGLGVRFTDDGRTATCRLERAECVGTDRTPEEAFAFVPRVVNGRGEAAQMVRRGDAIDERDRNDRAFWEGIGKEQGITGEEAKRRFDEAMEKHENAA